MSTTMGLRAYVIRRLLIAIPTLIGVSLIVFSLSMAFHPYERAALYVTTPKAAEHIEEIVKKYGLDKPFYVQYFTWLSNVLKGNLGYSKSMNIPVARAFTELWPASAELALYTIPFLVLTGITLGKISAVYKDKAPDHLARVFAIIGWSLPSFWSGIVLLAVFYGGLGWFPPGRLSVEAQSIVNSPAFRTVSYTHLTLPTN